MNFTAGCVYRIKIRIPYSTRREEHMVLCTRWGASPEVRLIKLDGSGTITKKEIIEATPIIKKDMWLRVCTALDSRTV